MKKLIILILLLTSSALAGDKVSDIYAPGCTGLSGIKIYLYNTKDSLVKIDSTTTDANGMYTFTPSSTGNYRVKEAPNGNWVKQFDFLETLGDTVYFDTSQVRIARKTLLDTLIIGNNFLSQRFQIKVGTNQNMIMRSSNATASFDALNDAGSAFVQQRFEATSFSFMTGLVGIGVVSPGNLLDIYGNSTNDNRHLRLTNTATGGNVWEIGEMYAQKKLTFRNITGGGIGVMTLDTTGVAIGTTVRATSAVLDLTSTTGALLVPRMTTTQRDALTAVNGMIIYNSTTNAFNFYEAGAWVLK